MDRKGEEIAFQQKCTEEKAYVVISHMCIERMELTCTRGLIVGMCQ